MKAFNVFNKSVERNFSDRMAQNNNILCPFCLTEIPSNSEYCSNENCEKDIPIAYRIEAVKIKPTIISAVGFRGHGKTVYLASLFHVMQELSSIWPGFYRQALNMESLYQVQKNAALLRSGKSPQGTENTFKEPSIQLLNSIPNLSKKLLLLFDTSGENYKTDRRIKEFASFVAKSKVILMLVSIDELQEEKSTENISEKLHNLLNIYKLGMASLEAKTNNQLLVIVLTKGDQLTHYFEKDYKDLVDYITTSELDMERMDMVHYAEQMKVVSERLKQFSRKVLKADSFLNMAEVDFARVEICLTSALGSKPEGEMLTAQISPRRVIDPLLWAFSSDL